MFRKYYCLALMLIVVLAATQLYARNHNRQRRGSRNVSAQRCENCPCGPNCKCSPKCEGQCLAKNKCKDKCKDGSCERKPARPRVEQLKSKVRSVTHKVIKAPRSFVLSFTDHKTCKDCIALAKNVSSERVQKCLHEKRLPFITCDVNSTPADVFDVFQADRLPMTILATIGEGGKLHVDREHVGLMSPQELVKFFEPPAPADKSPLEIVEPRG